MNSTAPPRPSDPASPSSSARRGPSPTSTSRAVGKAGTTWANARISTPCCFTSASRPTVPITGASGAIPRAARTAGRSAAAAANGRRVDPVGDVGQLPPPDRPVRPGGRDHVPRDAAEPVGVPPGVPPQQPGAEPPDPRLRPVGGDVVVLGVDHGNSFPPGGPAGVQQGRHLVGVDHVRAEPAEDLPDPVRRVPPQPGRLEHARQRDAQRFDLRGQGAGPLQAQHGDVLVEPPARPGERQDNALQPAEVQRQHHVSDAKGSGISDLGPGEFEGSSRLERRRSRAGRPTAGRTGPGTCRGCTSLRPRAAAASAVGPPAAERRRVGRRPGAARPTAGTSRLPTGGGAAAPAGRRACG